MAILPKWSSSKLLHCQVQGPRGNSRTKPASIEWLRNSPLIASMFANGVSQQQHIERTNPLSTLWPTSVSRSWLSSFWGSGDQDDRISSDGRSAASICPHAKKPSLLQGSIKQVARLYIVVVTTLFPGCGKDVTTVQLTRFQGWNYLVTTLQQPCKMLVTRSGKVVYCMQI